MNKQIFVYEDGGLQEPTFVGTLYSDRVNAREVFAFEYGESWLQQGISLDPDLLLYSGRQYLKLGKQNFGCFGDASPDRWGRLLMQRRESILARQQQRRPRKLFESDYLLGVYDLARIGSLRFKLDGAGEFLANDRQLATPPWVALRELEQAAWGVENGDVEDEGKWLGLLLAPGSSLGGARPKATVQDTDGQLWIAKFPSKYDEYDSGAWEMVVHDLALQVGLNAPEAKLEQFSDRGSTFLVRRFDRNNQGRLHYASAMTLLGKVDGEGDISYLDLAKLIVSAGVKVQEDLEELWKRLAFNMLVGNTDDHLRNHGFLLQQNGWRLSPLFDVNPVPYGENLGLLVDEVSSLINEDLLLSTAGYYGLEKKKAENLYRSMGITVKNNWRKLAKHYGINRNAMVYMEPAFSRI